MNQTVRYLQGSKLAKIKLNIYKQMIGFQDENIYCCVNGLHNIYKALEKS